MIGFSFISLLDGSGLPPMPDESMGEEGEWPQKGPLVSLGGLLCGSLFLCLGLCGGLDGLLLSGGGGHVGDD